MWDQGFFVCSAVRQASFCLLSPLSAYQGFTYSSFATKPGESHSSIEIPSIGIIPWEAISRTFLSHAPRAALATRCSKLKHTVYASAQQKKTEPCSYTALWSYVSHHVSTLSPFATAYTCLSTHLLYINGYPQPSFPARSFLFVHLGQQTPQRALQSKVQSKRDVPIIILPIGALQNKVPCQE